MKIKLVKNKQLNPFGGINFIIKEMNDKGISSMINNNLGKRIKQSKYQYSDVLGSWILNCICGAKRIEDVQKKYFRGIPNINQPSSDRVAQIFRSLACKSKLAISDSKIIHPINFNLKLNNLLIDSALKLKLLEKKSGYLLDYDNTVIINKKFDSKKTYLEGAPRGYQPGCGFINSIPVFIEGRNGNTPSLYHTLESIKTCINFLDNKNITVSEFRADAAFHNGKLMEYLDSNGITFYIRDSNKASSVRRKAKYIKNWHTIKNGNQLIEIGSAIQKAAHLTDEKNKSYRFVVTKKISKNREVFRGILTNDLYEKSDKEILEIYNERAGRPCEERFKILKNDFCWNKLPFSFMEENTVFMIISAMAYIIYRHCKIKFSKVLDFVKPNKRLKHFIHEFILISSEWIGDRLILHTDKNFNLLNLNDT